MNTLILSFKEMSELGRKVALQLGGKYCEVEVDKFPDGESHVKIKENPAQKTVTLISSLAHESNTKIIETLLAGSIARDFGAKKVILVATYVPYMRQDKHFDKYDALSALPIIKLFSEFDEVIGIDPHLHRIRHLRDVCRKGHEITASGLIALYIKNRFKEEFTIVGPDSESQQWGKKIARILGRKAIILSKHRFSSERVKMNERALGKNVLIIDDIISTGHTMLETIKMAKRHGAKKIICIGIHGIFAKNCDKRIRKYGELVTTNTIPNKYARIDVSSAIVGELRRSLQ